MGNNIMSRDVLWSVCILVYRVIPSEAVKEPCGHRLQLASWFNILLISIEIAGQIGVSPYTDFHQIGPLNIE